MKMEYKTIVAVVAIVTAAFIVSCDQKLDQKPSNLDRGADPVVEPSTPPPRQPQVVEPSPLSSLSDKYDMLNLEASKDWLRKHYWEVTSHSDNQIIIQRNYKSGNITDRRKVSLGPKGQRGFTVINNTMFTVDENDNIRVGLLKSESD